MLKNNADVKVTKRKYKHKLKYDPRAKQYDFLKWWRVVRVWALKKYEIPMQDLELILFLYTEGLFTKTDFLNYTRILKWERNKLKRMLEEGYIVLWREHKGYKMKNKLYTLSIKSKRICNSVYKKLMQEERMSEAHENNPIYAKKTYMNLQYRKVIELMNKRKEEKDEKNN